jgi:hypothetical protein
LRAKRTPRLHNQRLPIGSWSLVPARPVAKSDQADCVRAVVALTAAGKTMIDERSRVLELDALTGTSFDEARPELGDDVVKLDSPDGSPPIGKVGLYDAPGRTATVVVTAAGKRQFVRWDGDVYSTNVRDFVDTDFTFAWL